MKPYSIISSAWLALADMIGLDVLLAVTARHLLTLIALHEPVCEGLHEADQGILLLIG